MISSRISRCLTSPRRRKILCQRIDLSTFATASSRRRKPRTLSRKLAVTTKDRLRQPNLQDSWRQTYNLNPDELAERLSTRLQWARKTLKGVWREATGANPKMNRPNRPNLEMNMNWWCWNILLAMSPAFVLVLYCELIGRPRYEEFRADLEAQEVEGGGEQSSSIFLDDESSTSSLSDFLRMVRHYFWNDEEAIGELDNPSIPRPKQEATPSPRKTQHMDADKLKELEALKLRLAALEAEWKNKSTVNKPAESPMQQRRRLQAKKKKEVEESNSTMNEISQVQVNEESSSEEEQRSLFDQLSTLVSGFLAQGPDDKEIETEAADQTANVESDSRIKEDEENVQEEEANSNANPPPDPLAADSTGDEAMEENQKWWKFWKKQR